MFIGVGHGGTDPGATSGNLVEKNINLVMALACKEELERHGINVKMSRTKDEHDPVAQEVKECNAFNPDIALDCHSNAGGGDGFEVFHWQGSNAGYRLARLIESEIKALGQNSRGVKANKKLKFLSSTRCTAVLAEGFFLDNKTDSAIADTTAEQQAFGRAYARGILNYLGITHRPKTTSVYRVQVGAFDSKANANDLAKELKSKGYPAYVTT